MCQSGFLLTGHPVRRDLALPITSDLNAKRSPQKFSLPYPTHYLEVDSVVPVNLAIAPSVIWAAFRPNRKSLSL